MTVDDRPRFAAFSGQTLTQLRFDYAVTLLGSDGDRLRIEAPITVRVAGFDALVRADDCATSGAIMLGLLHQVCVSAGLADDATLTMTFENGDHLIVHPDPDYEAWSLNRADGSMLVAGPGDRLSEFHVSEVSPS